MANQKTFHLNAYETTLAGALNTTATTVSLTTIGALASPCWLVIDKDDPAKREYVYVTNVAGSIITMTRYQSGSAAGSGISHDAGATVHLTPTKQSFDDLHDRLEAHTHTNTGTPNSGATISHDDLDDVSSDDHHAQSHAHNGADSSGTVAHSDTTGKGVDDHHTEDHAARHAAGADDEFLHAAQHVAGAADEIATIAGLLSIQYASNGVGANLGTSYATVLSATFTPPGSWTTYDLYVEGLANLIVVGGAETVHVDARLVINAVNQTGVEPDSSWPVDHGAALAPTGSATGLSGAVTVNLQARRSGGTTNNKYNAGTLKMTGVRKT